MKNLKDRTSQPQESGSHTVIGHLKELMESQGWKLISKEIDSLMGQIKEKLWIPCSDESFRFNARNLLNERLTALFVLRNLPKIKLDEFEQIMKTEKEQQTPLQERLENANKKLSEELKRYIKL